MMREARIAHTQKKNVCHSFLLQNISVSITVVNLTKLEILKSQNMLTLVYTLWVTILHIYNINAFNSSKIYSMSM